MKILVTGAAGFIGCHVCRMLLHRGHRVIAVDNMSGDDGLSDKRVAFAEEPSPYNISFREAEASSTNVLSDIESGAFDVIVHLAAEPGVRQSIKQPQFYVEANVNPVIKILEALKGSEGGNTRFIYASSSSVYGNAPFNSYDEISREPNWYEDAEKRPLSPYAISKSTIEDFALYYSRSWEIDTVGVRPFTVFGKFQRKDLAVKAWADAIYSGKAPTVYESGYTPTLDKKRDMTHVTDVAELFCTLCERGYFPFRFVNAGRGSPVRMGDVLELINQRLDGDKEPVKVNTDAKEFEPDVTRAATALARYELGWEFKTGNTFSGIERMLKEENYF